MNCTVVTPEQIMEACERYQQSLDNPGFCIACGAEAECVEPDAENTHPRILRRSQRLRGRAAFDRHVLTGLPDMKTTEFRLTEAEARELRVLLAQEINDTTSNRKARILRGILTKLDHAAIP